MKVTLLDVPYDCGHYDERAGSGPLVLAPALAASLEAAGHDVVPRPVRLPAGFFAEVAAVSALQRLLHREVSAARAEGRFPVVLSGNCGYACLGTIAGLPPHTAVLWLDAHADFNTPETSPSGFFDGTALATLTGRAWSGVRRSFAGLAPVAEERVLLLGARDLDEPEREALAGSEVTWIPPAAQRRDPAALAAALDALAARAERCYLHVDLDVVDPSELRANGYACEGGLGVDEIAAVIRAAGERLELAAVAFTAYDPAVDVEGRGPAVAARLLEAVVEAAARVAVA